MAFSLVLGGMVADPVYAEHESRSIVLSDVGLDFILVALTIAGAILAVGAFAVAVIRWERRDEEEERLARSQTGKQDRQPPGQAPSWRHAGATELDAVARGTVSHTASGEGEGPALRLREDER